MMVAMTIMMLIMMVLIFGFKLRESPCVGSESLRSSGAHV